MRCIFQFREQNIMKVVKHQNTEYLELEYDRIDFLPNEKRSFTQLIPGFFFLLLTILAVYLITSFWAKLFIGISLGIFSSILLIISIVGMFFSTNGIRWLCLNKAEDQIILRFGHPNSKQNEKQFSLSSVIEFMFFFDNTNKEDPEDRDIFIRIVDTLLDIVFFFKKKPGLVEADIVTGIHLTFFFQNEPKTFNCRFPLDGEDWDRRIYEIALKMGNVLEMKEERDPEEQPFSDNYFRYYFCKNTS